MEPGETLWGIADGEGVPLEDLAELNGIEDPTDLHVGQNIFVPEAGFERARRRIDHNGGIELASLMWPVCGTVSSVFGLRDGRPHEGMDVAAPAGTDIRAAAGGTVAFSGWQRGYGRMIILKHEKPFLTVYAHTSANLVGDGDTVAAGQTIARVGSSGRSSGPHVHFELRRGSEPLDPRRYLGACR